MGGAPMSPQAMQGMMYGPGGSPSSPGYVDYESIYREMQLRVYAAQRSSSSGARPSAPGGLPRAGRPAPAAPSRRAASPSTTPPPSPLKPYTNIRRCRWAPTPTKTAPRRQSRRHVGGGRRRQQQQRHRFLQAERRAERHARRRRQLARLAADRLEWEVRSRQMEQALLAKEGGADGEGAFPGGTLC